jgi:hypothetical protein
MQNSTLNWLCPFLLTSQHGTHRTIPFPALTSLLCAYALLQKSVYQAIDRKQSLFTESLLSNESICRNMIINSDHPRSWINLTCSVTERVKRKTANLKMETVAASAKIFVAYLLTELSPSWEAANCAAIQKIPSNFKEPEGSSPCSQEPSAGPSPEPLRSSPHTIPSYLSKIHFNIVHHLRLGLPSGLFPSGFPTTIWYAFLVSPMVA